MKSIVYRFTLTIAAAGLFLAGAGVSRAQTDGEMELIEARAALQIAATKLAAVEKKAAALEKEVAAIEGGRTALAESLAAANAEAKQYRESYRELRLQMEALGVEALLPNSGGIEQRLLKAVSDNRLLEDEKKKLAEQLVRLSEATMSYLAMEDEPGAEARTAVETELKAAADAVRLSGAEDAPAAVALDEATVINLNPDFSLVVLNAGASSGARVGMPVNLRRDSRVVATALVVDVRNRICGAIVQGVAQEGDIVQIGDQVEVRTEGSL